MQPLITAKNLNFSYNKGKENEFKALVNVNLNIYPEEFVIFFGPSGCGKSTLLNIIAGLENTQGGTIFVSGKDVSKMTKEEFVSYHRKSIGMVFQSYNLITSLSVLDNVALPQIFLNISKKERDIKGMELLERFGIAPQAKKIPTELSGGQQQRIGIARAIVNEPEIILADEPIGNLDSMSADNVLKILKNLNEKEKRTIILVTHNPEFLEYGDKVFYMKDGMVTRETVNTGKAKVSHEKGAGEMPSTELENLMRAYSGLSPEQINVIIMPYKSRLFAHHFVSSRNMEEIKILENIIYRKLLNIITQEEFFDTLKRPYQEGGVGFDVRTAEKTARRVNRKIRMAYYVYRKGHQRKGWHGEHKKVTDEEKANKTTTYLLKTCYNEYYKNLKEEEIERLKNAVKDRLFRGVNKIDFFNFVDKPFKDGGVGLNSKTARAITEELELILILGYGVTPNIREKKEFKSPEKAKLAEQKERIAKRVTHNV
ncbi:MAG: ABC transporter ATP-binding protein [Candidatus Falkowbacteria bacterium]